jgi:hypothetical protein
VTYGDGGITSRSLRGGGQIGLTLILERPHRSSVQSRSILTEFIVRIIMTTIRRISIIRRDCNNNIIIPTVYADAAVFC